MIKEEDYKIPLEWFSDNLMSSSSFRRWKKTLKDVKTLRSREGESNWAIFYEDHEFK
jgi:hypothetical protein